MSPPCLDSRRRPPRCSLCPLVRFDGLREHPLTAFALVHARVIPAPGQVLEDAAIVVRDGRIVAVGSDVHIPGDAQQIDMQGRTIYPGFVEAWSEIEVPDVTGGAPHWNAQVQPQRRVADHLSEAFDSNEAYRSQGFVARLAAPQDGVIKGVSAVVLLGDGKPSAQIVQQDAALHVRLTVSRGRGQGYPSSPMGAVALARQTLLDAQWHQLANAAHRADPSLPRPERNDALEALAPYLHQNLVMFDAGNELFCIRADQFAREFGLRIALHGSGNEYRRLDAIQAAGRAVILPLDFPQPPNVATAETARDVSLESLLHWDLAPENPARLHRAGVAIAFTTEGLSSPKDFLAALRKAVQRGLPADAALQGLTTTPATLLDCADQLGSIAAGKMANLVVADGDLFHEESSNVVETWVEGRRYEIKKADPANPAGVWEFAVAGQSPWSMTLTGKSAAKLEGELVDPADAKHPLQKVGVRDDRFSAVVDAKPFQGEGLAYLSGVFFDDVRRMQGVVTISGKPPLNFQATWKNEPPTSTSKQEGPDAENKPDEASAKPDEAAEASPSAEATDPQKSAEKSSAQESDQEKPAETASKQDEQEKPVAASFEVNYPLGAFGRSQPPPQQRVLFRNATVWTCGAAGRLVNADILIDGGLIIAVGTDLAADNATVVDLSGKHLTPGLIDCHSHMATDGGVNEGTQAVTAEVRIADFIDSDDMNIYRQLAGGVTSSNILHGSANPIGGQNQVIKLRWGALPDDMKFAEAPAGIKFALGENVKRSNFTGDSPSRYPISRMGVVELIRDTFQAAKEYHARHEDWRRTRQGLPPRRDLELEAIAEILQHQRWVHCHSYRQDEILALLRLLEEYDVTIGSLQHILEGYKVADAMARHGAMGSSFSDWWAYKFEVYDAIPYNGALMHRAGVVVSYNSDDRELARHLNHEAAKAVKYGGVPPEEALKFVTLNPAKQLRIDSYVGSIEVGKQADLVVWSDRPLSTLSRCEQTWVDGRRQFDIKEDLTLRQEAARQKTALIAKILQSGEAMRKPGEGRRDESELWPRWDEYCGHGHEHDEFDTQHEHEHQDQEVQR